jgi:tetratricopeptide (TPR) repeat protein
MALQDPEFSNFKRAFNAARFDDALQSVKKLLAKYPQSLALHWHHTRVLERLERFGQARIALNKVLKLRSDFVPALIMQVQLDFHDGTDADIEDEIFDEEPAQHEHARFDIIEQRLYKILSIDPTAVDALHMLSGLLRGHEGDAHLAKANQLLNRAISLAPERVDLLEDRANSLLAKAVEPENNPHSDAADRVITVAGTRYSRNILEQALTDFQHCYELSRQHRYGLRVGSILHDLGRFDEALAAYDKVLGQVPEDDPYRSLIIERRERSKNNGSGEREHMAQMLEAAVTNDGNSGNDHSLKKNRSLEKNTIAQAILSAAHAVRSGKSVSAALESRLSDDPEENMTTSIAVQILNVANDPHPGLAAVDPKDFPAYQQKFIAQAKHDLIALGLQHVCDAEAMGMRLMLGQSVLVSFFADQSGETGVACFTMRPVKPNTIVLLSLLLRGKWQALTTTSKAVKMVECVSQFNNGDHLSTQYFSPSPFEYGAPIYVEKLPANSSAADLVELHLKRLADYKQLYPQTTAMRALDLAGMEQRWIKGQAVKRAYRTKIGYITDSELHALLGVQYDKFAQKVRAKINLLAADL